MTGRAGWGAGTRFESWRQGWRGHGLALLAGMLLPWAFAPLSLFPLALLAPAILFWLWLDATPRLAFIRGYLFGVGFFAVGVSWVAVSFYRFGGMGAFLSFAATLLFILFLALFPATHGWLSRRYFSRLSRGAYLLLLLPLLWVLLEWVRAWILTGFPWLNLGYSQTDSPLIGLAPVVGVYGISWAVAMSAALLLWLLLTAGRQRLVALAGLLMLWLLAGSLSLISWSDDKGQPLTASLIQGNVPQNLKWRPEQRAPTIDLYTRLSRQRWHRDVVIWPETALPAYFHQAQTFLQGLAREAHDNGGAQLVVGLPMLAENDTSHYFNAVVRVGRGEVDGDPSQFYRKSHLVPFGEYIPLKAVLGRLLDILHVPMADFSRGDSHQPLLTVGEHPVGVSICYEDAFGEEVIRGLPQADFLINVSNDAWFGDSLAPHQHLQMARMRTIETARPMLRATNNGISAIIDQHGKVLATSPQFQVAVLDGSIQPQQGATPYVRVGNWPVISALFLGLGFCLWRGRVR
jgi:apolipoprotein N-acyltransferase